MWSFDQIIVLLKHLPYAQLQDWCRFVVKSFTASCSVTETGTWEQLQNKNTRLHCTTHFCCYISVFDLSVQRWIKALRVPACSLAKGTLTLFVWRSNCTIPFWSLINKSRRYLQILWWHVGIFGFFFGISFTKFPNTLSDAGVFTSSDLCLLHLGSRCQKNLLPSFFCLVSDSAAVGLNSLWQIGS